MKRFDIFFFMGLIVWVACQPSGDTPHPQGSLEEKISQWVSDSRVVLFEPSYRYDSVAQQWNIAVISTEEELLDSVRQWCEHTGFPCASLQRVPFDSVKTNWALVNLSVANIRSAPTHSAELVTQVLLGHPVRVLYAHDGWVRVQTADYYIGWLTEGALHRISSDHLQAWQETQRLLYASFSGRLHEKPHPKSAYVQDVVLGALLEDAAVYQNGYRAVRLPDGHMAWLPEESLQDFDEVVDQWQNVTAQDLIYTGEELMGVPYLWGGTSSKGVDCSGFTKTIFWMNGFLLPRDASQQVFVGEEVPLTDSLTHVEAGDLLYFGRQRADGSPKVTHVALYMGQRYILHSSGRVKVESLAPSDSLFNRSRYESLLFARRILGNGSRANIQPVQTHTWY